VIEMTETVTLQQLINAGLDADTFAQATNSDGYNGDTTTNRDGVTINTLQGLAKKLGYQPPISYSGGISYTNTDITKTVDFGGNIYAPVVNNIPFTTSGTWAGADEDNFYPIQTVQVPVNSVGTTELQDDAVTLDKVDSSIQSTLSQVGANSSAIAANTSSISNNASSISANAAANTANTDAIAVNAAAIAANAAAIDAVSTKIFRADVSVTASNEAELIAAFDECSSATSVFVTLTDDIALSTDYVFPENTQLTIDSFFGNEKILTMQRIILGGADSILFLGSDLSKLVINGVSQAGSNLAYPRLDAAYINIQCDIDIENDSKDDSLINIREPITRVTVGSALTPNTVSINQVSGSGTISFCESLGHLFGQTYVVSIDNNTNQGNITIPAGSFTY